ncbi:ABC transporter substrate-binding protein [Labrys monachus]|uniref:NitT/TauT family transport system substrate-binding protein n=1 Tax=Labrys monachus TaxID=217067 RepID=A0ABU0FGT2_9HYPH|nr:NitT/TauT family transport system substrate-binding protein [Labrys monachus]
MKKTLFGAALALSLGFAVPAMAATSVAIGISGWTGFAPLTLAKVAGIFEKHGLDVTLKKVPQATRPLAIASGDLQCAATTVETWLVWNANGVAAKQIFQLDKSYGADGIVARADIKTVTDLKGKRVAASAPGTSPFFMLAWVLAKSGLTTKDVTVVNLEPDAAAQAFLAGQNDAAVSYEPYLSAVRDKPDQGHILATTLDYPMVLDTVGCTPAFLDAHPDAAKALADSYFEALDMIKASPDKANALMGADVKQSAAEFADSAKYLLWADKDDNKKFFNDEFQSFSKTAGDLLLQMGLIKSAPDVSTLADTRFVN